MPTNEERREVAEKIRKMVEDRYNFTALNVADVIGVEEVVFDDRYAFDEACWLRLVDLIEPEPDRTCHLEETDHAYETSFRCDACNRVVWVDFKGNIAPNYCPNCGARVVE